MDSMQCTASPVPCQRPCAVLQARSVKLEECSAQNKALEVLPYTAHCTLLAAVPEHRSVCVRFCHGPPCVPFGHGHPCVAWPGSLHDLRHPAPLLCPHSLLLEPHQELQCLPAGLWWTPMACGGSASLQACGGPPWPVVSVPPCRPDWADFASIIPTDPPSRPSWRPVMLSVRS